MRGKSFKTKGSGKNILMNYQYNYDKMDNIMTKATDHGDYTYKREWGQIFPIDKSHCFGNICAWQDP